MLSNGCDPVTQKAYICHTFVESDLIRWLGLWCLMHYATLNTVQFFITQIQYSSSPFVRSVRGRRGHEHMVVEFTTAYAMWPWHTKSIYLSHFCREWPYKVIRVMVFNATFNNISVISWWSVLLVEET
jgi:hypothetical protein